MKRSFIFILFLFVVGCVHYPTSDYMPSKSVDMDLIDNAKPKTLPKSRYGNAPSYIVRGKRYAVLPSARGYDETGIASWYGMKFAGHLTSMRDVYDPYAMTAASKVLPLPTFTKVTNLENGRWIIVKVNDRGPFVNNRIMDLSYAAAKKLGVVKYGTGLVRVQVINPEDDEKEKEGRTLPDKNPMIYLQVGAYANVGYAKKMANRIHDVVDAPCKIYPNTLNGKTLYRVKIGPIIAVDTSDNIVATLVSKGIPAPITQIS